MAYKYIPISINNSHSFNDSLRPLIEYQNTLDQKVRLALDTLTREGISMAVVRCGNFGPGIRFYRQQGIDSLGNHEMYLVGEDASKIISRWWKGGHIEEAEVSPLLMAEFGSGSFADGINQHENQPSGVGRGTFPGQTHAFQSIWFWKDADDGELKSSSGIAPTQPMLRARNTMVLTYVRIFREVFL